MPEELPEEEVGSVLGTGTWRDWLPKIPRPVFATGTRDLYLVLFEGSGFTLPIEGGEPATGFFKNAVVAARNSRDAEESARHAVLREWRRKGFLKLAGAHPTLEVDTISVLPERFRLRSSTGFGFF